MRAETDKSPAGLQSRPYRLRVPKFGFDVACNGLVGLTATIWHLIKHAFVVLHAYTASKVSRQVPHMSQKHYDCIS